MRLSTGSWTLAAALCCCGLAVSAAQAQHSPQKAPTRPSTITAVPHQTQTPGTLAGQRPAKATKSVGAAGSVTGQISAHPKPLPKSVPIHGGSRGGNDECASATPISGSGPFSYNNTGATDSSQAYNCGFNNGRDVWFDWTSPGNGTVTVSLCGGGTSNDSAMMAFAADCATNLACNDDFCGLVSQISFAGTAGTHYKIRIAAYNHNGGGSGTFTVTQSAPPPPPPCTQPAQNCQSYNPADADNSNPAFYTCYEDFTLAGAGNVTGVCFRGCYIPESTPADAFTVTYYQNNGGAVGAQIASFSQGSGLTVVGPAPTGGLIAGFANEYEYLATHAPVALVGNHCYFISITNACGNTSWYWEISAGGNGRALQQAGAGSPGSVGNDLGFCLNVQLGSAASCVPAGPGNDECTGASAISGTGTFAFDNSNATNSPDGQPCGLIGRDVWFRWTAPGTSSYRVSLCTGTSADTVVAGYSGACGGLTVIACDDDFCGGFSSSQIDMNGITAGTAYYIRVGMYNGGAGTSGTFTISEITPPPPPPCTQPAQNCQAGDVSDADNSNPAFYTSYEDFALASNGSVTGVCFRGTYLPAGLPADAFTVSYYEDNNDSVGTLIASFSQGSGLTVIGPAPTGGLIAGFATEYEYLATHAPVALLGNHCYFISVTNNCGNTSWYWEISFAGNGHALQQAGAGAPARVNNDLGFCLNVQLGSTANCNFVPPPDPCTEPAQNCQAGDLANAYNSTNGQFTTADDFAVSASGTISNLCFRGTYAGSSSANDNYTVTYFSNTNGTPGTQIASFSQSGGTLTVASALTGGLIAGGFPENTYSVTHAPVAVVAGRCYFVQVLNNLNGGTWFWEQSFAGNSYAVQNGGAVPVDMSLCINLALADDHTCNTRARCCMPDGSCQLLNAPGCAAANGRFDATHSDCGGAYNMTQGTGTIVAGTTNVGLQADDGTIAFALPFPVSFYGTSYNSVTLSSNGNLQFTGASAAYGNGCLPDAQITGAAMFPHWDDLYTADAASGEGIFTSVTGAAGSRTLHIEYRTVYCCTGGAPSVNFEVRLHENSAAFEFIYGTADRGSATVGIQDGAGGNMSFECNQAGVIVPGLMLSFTAQTGQVCTPSCRADFNGDGQVNVQDFLAFLAAYAAGNSRCDIDNNGQVNVQDFLAYLALYAHGC